MNGERRVLMILGMHRSGTSLFTNWLNECGLNVGDCLLGSHKSNPKGHFEDLDFLNFHEKILKDNKNTWKVLNNNKIEVNKRNKLLAKTIIENKFTKREQWGWKDPRTCLFLDLWLELLPFACNVMIYRDYKDVVYSLFKRDIGLITDNTLKGYFKRNFFLYKKNEIINNYLRAWCIYNEELINSLNANSNTLFINIVRVQEFDYQIFNHLKTNWGFKLNYKPFSEVFNESFWTKKTNEEFQFKYNSDLVDRAEVLLRELELLQYKSIQILDKK